MLIHVIEVESSAGHIHVERRRRFRVADDDRPALILRQTLAAEQTTVTASANTASLARHVAAAGHGGPPAAGEACVVGFSRAVIGAIVGLSISSSEGLIPPWPTWQSRQFAWSD